MSLKAQIAAAAATFALAGGGLGTVGTLSASAATPSCGHDCSDLFTQKFGPAPTLTVTPTPTLTVTATALHHMAIRAGATPLRPHPSPGYTYYINGATDRFSNPLVLNYPAGYPTDMPRPWLTVQPLHYYADGTVFDNQQWKSMPGPVHGGM
jgi:hypothetical protein